MKTLCSAGVQHFFHLPLIGGALIPPDRHGLEANARLCEMLGYTQAELRQRPWTALVHADDQAREAALFAQLCAGEIEQYTVDLRLLGKSGSPLWAELSMAYVRHEQADQSFAVVAVHDISHYKSEQERLQALAMRDPLTGLLNRRGLMDALDHLWSLAARQQAPLALLFLDLDQFKSVNDNHGHRLGDRVLAACADRLRGSLRTADRLGRYGGDEFIALLPWTDAAGAHTAAERLRAACHETAYDIEPVSIQLTVSVGVASIIPTADMRPETLITRADQSLYQAKQERS